MVGGTVIEAKLVRSTDGPIFMRIWCADRHGDECAVYADKDEGANVKPGDRVWWQGRKIYWSREGAFNERELRKIGFSFDPRNVR